MNNLRKFTTEADYSAATLNYPAVSWVTSGDTVHFDKAAPVVVNDKVMIGFFPDSTGSATIHFYNPYGTNPSTYFSYIALNDVEINPISAETTTSFTGFDFNIIKYGITTTTINDCFSGELGGATSAAPNIEILIPSKVTSIDSLPVNDINSMVVEATTPPFIDSTWTSVLGSDCPIYVPDGAVSAYQNDANWSAMIIYPISEYSGNLPV